MNEELMNKQIKKTMHSMVSCLVNKDREAFFAMLGDKMSEVKTVKNGVNAKATNNATFIIRFANDLGIQHPRVAKYYAKLNSNGKKNTTGINATTDKEAVLAVFVEVIKAFKSVSDLQQKAINFVTRCNQHDDEEEEEEDDTLDFNINMAMPVSIDNDPDFDDEEEEEETADVTETSYVLDEWSVSVKRKIANVTDEEIAQAKAVLHKTNKNGDGYEMTLSGKKEIVPSSMAKLIDWDTQLLKAAADILCIAPKRNKKWVMENRDGTATTYKTRSWFPELCGANNKEAAKKFTLRLAAYVILASKRNFWTARFAWSVSDDFRESFRAFIGINEEVADSPVIGGQAQSWHWPLVKNDWTPTSSKAMTDEDFRSLDIGSLDSL